MNKRDFAKWVVAILFLLSSATLMTGIFMVATLGTALIVISIYWLIIALAFAVSLSENG